jgi:hypothetical protein
MTDGQVLIGRTATTPANAALSGDVTMTNAGVVAIGAAKVTNAMLAGSIDLTAKVTGTLPVGNGGTGITALGTGVATFLGTPSSANLLAALTDKTGTGAAVFSTNPTLVTPILGTPTSGTLTACTGLPVAGIVSSTSTALGLGSVELGHATDTTIARLAAGIPGVEGAVLQPNAYTTTATAAGTTTLTVTSTSKQFFTGSTTQTVVLPVTSTLTTGHTFKVVNNSTGQVTVQSSGANNILVMGPSSEADFICILTSGTSAASWQSVARYLNVPINSQSAAYTTVISDAGKAIFHPSADTTARTFTIDSNANVAFPVGTVITFINQISAGVVTIAITTDTMYLAGAGTTGSRTLAANGMATAIKMTSTTWLISGSGLT